MNVEDARLDEIARQIKAIFFEKKKEITGRVYKPGARHKNFTAYQKAAAQCMKLHLDPDRFVNLAFEACPFKSGPFPNMLSTLGEKGWHNYQALTKPVNEEKRVNITVPEMAFYTIDPTIVEELRFELTQATLYNMKKAKSHDISIPQLMDDFEPIGPEIRVILGYPDNRIKEKYGKEAFKVISKPAFRAALIEIGRPADDILAWLTS